MSQVLITRTILKAIADQIRDKLDIPDKITPSEMAELISTIEGVNVDRAKQCFTTYMNSTTPGSFIREGRFANFSNTYAMVTPLDPLALTPIAMDYSQPWEIGAYFRFKDTPSARQTIAGCYTNYYKSPTIELADMTLAKLKAMVSTNGTSWGTTQELAITGGLQLNTWYFVKLSWDGSDCYFGVTSDFENWDEMTWEQATAAYSDTDSIPCFGMTNKTKYVADKTEIDLDNTYLKSDGVLIWGAERFSGTVSEGE